MVRCAWGVGGAAKEAAAAAAGWGVVEVDSAMGRPGPTHGAAAAEGGGAKRTNGRSGGSRSASEGSQMKRKNLNSTFHSNPHPPTSAASTTFLNLTETSPQPMLSSAAVRTTSVRMSSSIACSVG